MGKQPNKTTQNISKPHPKSLKRHSHGAPHPCTSGGSCEATSGAKGTTGSEGGEGELGASTEDTVDRAAEAEARNLERRVSRVRRLASARTPREAAMRTSDFFRKVSKEKKGQDGQVQKKALQMDGFLNFQSMNA